MLPNRVAPFVNETPSYLIGCLLLSLLFFGQPLKAEQVSGTVAGTTHPRPESLGSVSESSVEDWPNYLGPRFDGTSAEKGLIQNWPAGGPRVLWSRSLGASYSAPVTSRGRLILFHRLENREVIEAVDALTGTPIWKQSYPSAYEDRFGFNGGPRSSPTVEGERVYTFGAEGKLTCLDFETGEVIWQRWINRDFRVPQNFFGVGSAPVIDDGRILLNAGGPQGAGIVAIDKDRGVDVWKTGEDEASYSTPVVRLIHGTRMGIFFTRRGLNVVEIGTGKEHYRYPFRSRNDLSVNAATPVVVDDYVFLSAAYRTGAVLLKLAPGGLEVVWKDPKAMNSHWATSIYHEGYLYGMNGRHEGAARFRCIDFMSGKVLWTAKQGLGRAVFVLAEGKLIALGERGILALIEASPESYRERARAQILKYPCWTPPVLSHGLLYVRNETRLLCLDLRK